MFPSAHVIRWTIPCTPGGPPRLAGYGIVRRVPVLRRAEDNGECGLRAVLAPEPALPDGRRAGGAAPSLEPVPRSWSASFGGYAERGLLSADIPGVARS